MVILRWIQSVISGPTIEATQAAAGQSANELEKKKKKNSKAIDLINAALVDHAEDLDDLITSGSTIIQRRKLKKQIRKKVVSAISEAFNDPEIIEEVTERITDAAEIDPYYKNLFSDEAK